MLSRGGTQRSVMGKPDTLVVPAQDKVRSAEDIWLVGFILLHIPLALLLRSSVFFSTVHALTVLAIGLGAALLRPKNDYLHLWVLGYIVGAEVLWRATGAAEQIAWEEARYFSFLILAVAIVRRGKDLRLPLLPVLYTLYQLPALLFYVGRSWEQFRHWALGTLLGPLAITAFAVYFSGLPLDRAALKRLAMVVLAPVVGIATLGAYNLLTLPVQFGMSANPLASGGTGPNQVSNTLALGAVLCWLLINQLRDRRMQQVLIAGILALLTVQMLLTFSRGGAWTLAIVAVSTFPLILRNNPHRWLISLLTAGLMALFLLVIWPWLDDLTSGYITRRYSSLDTTGRWELLQSEIQIWMDNPVFGIGPGLARERVDEYYAAGEMQAHVEFSRVLAEHGLLGLLALIFLIAASVRNYLRAHNWEARLWVLAATLFTFIYMAQSATRTVAPEFLYGLTWATLFAESEPSERSIGQTHAHSLRHRLLAH